MHGNECACVCVLVAEPASKCVSVSSCQRKQPTNVARNCNNFPLDGKTGSNNNVNMFKCGCALATQRVRFARNSDDEQRNRTEQQKERQKQEHRTVILQKLALSAHIGIGRVTEFARPV